MPIVFPVMVIDSGRRDAVDLPAGTGQQNASDVSDDMAAQNAIDPRANASANIITTIWQKVPGMDYEAPKLSFSYKCNIVVSVIQHKVVPFSYFSPCVKTT